MIGFCRTQPFETNARTPAFFTASKISVVNLSGSSTTIDPKPIYTGVSPDSRNFTNPLGGSKVEARSRKTKPAISISGPQSFGFGTRPGDHKYVYGTFAWSQRDFILTDLTLVV